MSGYLNNIRMALLSFFCLFLTGTISAQTINGSVKDNTGEPVIGATVIEQGASNNGTVTDIDGNFTIKLKGKSHKLSISYVGMKTQVVEVKGKSQVAVKLEDEATSLNDVVVIGYGSVKKKDLTGSVATVSSKALAEVPVASASEALTGKMAGVQVTTSEGSPDAEVKIRVRGGGSITQSNDPLYIVDGFPVDGIGDIPATDIEDITVLKDASSTAIYGSRGANGVILVTTKSGKSGKVNVSYNAYYSVKKIAKTMDLLTPYDYAKWQYELALLKNQKDITSYTDFLGNYQDMDMYKDVAANDWQDIVYGRTGHTFNQNLNINGGSETIKYAFSYAHMNDKAIQIGSNFKRDNFSLKLNTKPTKNTTLDFQVRYSDTDIRGGGANDATGSMDTDRRLKYALYYYPMPLSNLDESAGSDDDELGNLYNPVVSQYDNDRVKERKQLNFAGAFGWEIIKNLKAKVEFGYDDYNQYDQRYYGKTTYQARNSFSDYPGMPGITLEDTNRHKFRNTNTVSYDFKKLLKSKKHSLNMMVGHEYIITKKRTHSDEIHGFPSDFDANTAWKLTGQGHPVKVNDIYSADDKLLSFFTRANYNYEDKYLLSFTFRADASSKFSKDNRWGYFPSAAAAWTISNEKFWEPIKNAVEYMKIRASYGIIGNQDITPYSTLGSLGTTGFTYGTNQSYTGYWANGLATPDLSWEKVHQFDLGVDLGFFGNRLSISLDYFDKKTKDALLTTSAPGYLGGTSYWVNAGEVSNKGFDATINAQIIQTKDWSWSSTLNASYIKNEVTKLTADSPILYGTSPSPGTVDPCTIIKEGEAIGTFYGFKWAGVEKNAKGEYIDMYYTADGGTTATPDASKDRFVLGRSNPDFTLGWNNTVSYKNWDFNAFFNAAFGAKRLNMVRYAMNSMVGASMFVTDKDYFNNIGVTMPTVGAENKTYGNSDKWLENANYLRCENISIAYTFPRSVTKLADIRLSLSAQNLFTITGYKGIDPAGASFSDNGVDRDNGLDMGAYPNPRTITMGVRINF